VLIAEIIATNQDPYRQQLILDKGKRDGVYRGQAVVDAYGILGQVVRVNARSSTALMVTDPDHGVPVEINRTGLQAVALGQGSNRGLRLPFLPGNADIKKGDLLVSSSLGGRFPAGYPVGRIEEVRRVSGEHFIEAVATPAARLNQGRQALLVWSQQLPIDEAQAREAAAAEQAAQGAEKTPAEPRAP
jgi:rod shape-determining protein MreC